MLKKVSLINQETEEHLEELKGKYRDTKTQLDNEVDALKHQISCLEAAVQSSRTTCERLKQRTLEGEGGRLMTLEHVTPEQAVTLNALSSKVAEVYVR